ncbi:uncharacterized protein LOC119084418 isoform X2 [Bradysia coprophila]|uniref:uncharacterized protein LOC119084418 isoform X2 n=1 Tax=Bradysia coprophila TaxID=38358 RepID=UPI00187D82A8|nr:uncharacterized protein LOC119084418 isoform X2 [Bradysia coprophila]
MKISQLKMSDDQADASGKYGMDGRRPQGAAKYWPAIFKSIELLICILCIGLIDEPATNSRIRVFVSQRTVALAYSTFASYLIISAAYLFGKLVKDHWPWKTTAALSLIGFILYAACAATLLKDWVETKERNYWPPNTQRHRSCRLLYPKVHNSSNMLDLVCATGFICVIGAIVFLIELIAVARSGSRGDLGD